jgi:hypothetical protein
MRFLCIVLALVLMVSPGWAQRAMSIQQLVSFVSSSIKLKHQDKQVAQTLASVKLNFQLEQNVIDDLEGLGAGPKTLSRLRELRLESMNMPKAPDPVRQQIVAPLAGPSLAEQDRILGIARERAAKFTTELPDFTCVQYTRRYTDPAGAESWILLDTLTTRVGYYDSKEDYKLIAVNGRSAVGFEDKTVGGFTTGGEFGSFLRDLFDDRNKVKFAWDRWATLRGRRMHVFRYDNWFERGFKNISMELSKTERREENAPTRGLVYVDRDSGEVARITEEFLVSTGFPMQEANRILDYDYQTIANKQYLVPMRTEAKFRVVPPTDRTVPEFRLYQKFGVDTEIIFEAPEELPKDKVEESKPPKQ